VSATKAPSWSPLGVGAFDRFLNGSPVSLYLIGQMVDPSCPSVADAMLREAKWLRSLALSLVHDEHLADDVVQSTWLAALTHPPRRAGALRAWLGKVARRIAIRTGERERWRRAWEQKASRPEEQPPAADLVARASLHRALVEAVLDLEEPYRSTVLLRYFEELPHGEIAKRQEVALATVQTRLHRALEQLRVRLDRAAGGRDAWRALILAPMARAAVHATAAVGGIVMGTQLKIGIAAIALLIAGAVGWHATRSAQSEIAARPLRARVDDASGTSAATGENARGPAPALVRPLPSIDFRESEDLSSNPPSDRAQPWRVRAVDRSRMPVSGAEVTVNDQMIGKTDADGVVTVSVAQAMGARVAAKTDEMSGLAEIESPAPVFEITLHSAWTLRVTVVDAAGRPVERATVEGTLAIDGQVLAMPSKGSTDEAGLFVWTRIPSGAVNVTASHSNRYASARVNGWGEHVANITLRLSEGRLVVVSAVDESDRPVPHVELTAGEGNGVFPRGSPTLAIRTDADGRAEFYCPPTWQWMLLAATSDRWFLDPTEQQHHLAGGASTFVVHVTPAVALDLTLHGRHEGIHEITASAEFGRGFFRDAVGQGGRIRFIQLPSNAPVSVHLFIHTAHLQSVAVGPLTPGNHSRKVELDLTAVTVRVTDEEGKPLSSDINALATDGRGPHPRFGTAGPLMLNSRTDTEGVAQMNLPPGSYRLRSIDSNEVIGEVDCVVGVAPTAVALKVVRPKPWRIVLRSTDGKALSGWVVALQRSDHCYSAMSNTKGVAEFRAADGAYRVGLRSPLGLTHLAESGLRPPEPQEITIDLQTYTLTAMRLADGTPTPARIFVSPVQDIGQPLWERTRGVAIGTKANGMVTLETTKSDWVCSAIADDGARSLPTRVSPQDPSRELTLLVFDSYAPMAQLRTDNEHWVIDWRVAVATRSVGGRFTLRGAQGVVRVPDLLPLGPVDLTIIEGPAGTGRHITLVNEPGAVLVLPER
jgi:RNA polymerase sigma factor (sigma-70 family)